MNNDEWEEEMGKFRMTARKHADDWDAYMVESLRKMGRDFKQRKVYEKRVQNYLKKKGY